MIRFSANDKDIDILDGDEQIGRITKDPHDGWILYFTDSIYYTKDEIKLIHEFMQTLE